MNKDEGLRDHLLNTLGGTHSPQRGGRQESQQDFNLYCGPEDLNPDTEYEAGIVSPQQARISQDQDNGPIGNEEVTSRIIDRQRPSQTLTNSGYNAPPQTLPHRRPLCSSERSDHDHCRNMTVDLNAYLAHSYGSHMEGQHTFLEELHRLWLADRPILQERFGDMWQDIRRSFDQWFVALTAWSQFRNSGYKGPRSKFKAHWGTIGAA